MAVSSVQSLSVSPEIDTQTSKGYDIRYDDRSYGEAHATIVPPERGIFLIDRYPEIKRMGPVMSKQLTRRQMLRDITFGGAAVCLAGGRQQCPGACRAAQ